MPGHARSCLLGLSKAVVHLEMGQMLPTPSVSCLVTGAPRQDSLSPMKTLSRPSPCPGTKSGDQAGSRAQVCSSHTAARLGGAPSLRPTKLYAKTPVVGLLAGLSGTPTAFGLTCSALQQSFSLGGLHISHHHRIHFCGCYDELP